MSIPTLNATTHGFLTMLEVLLKQLNFYFYSGIHFAFK